MSKKEIAVSEHRHLAVAQPPQQSTVELTNKEKLYPVLRMVHGMTKKENKENPHGPAFVQGDMVIYPSRTKIATLSQPFHFIFLRNTLEWANFEEVTIQGKSREEWRSEEPRHNGNEDWALDYNHDGKKMKRYRQVTLFGLIPSQVEAFLKDALSDAPTMTGSVTPVALKTRNFSRKFAQQLLNIIGGDEFVARNRARIAAGKAAIPVYVYEHLIEVTDFTNKAGNTFPILSYKKTLPVLSKEVLEYAQFAYEKLAQETKLSTIIVEDDHEVASKGVVSDEV